MEHLVEQVQNLELETGERVKLKREVSNWMKLAKVIYDTKDINFLMKVLKVELEGECRAYMIHRTYSRISRLRNTAEKMQLSNLILKQEKAHAKRKKHGTVSSEEDTESRGEEL